VIPTNHRGLVNFIRARQESSLRQFLRTCCCSCLLGCCFWGGCGKPPDIGHRGITFDIAPSGDKIVFTAKGDGTRDLYLLDIHSCQVTRLSNTPAFESDPAFSPDGKWIVYSAFQNPDNMQEPGHLFLLNLETKKTRQLTSDKEGSDGSPVFVMNGSRILFSRAHRLRRYSMGGYTWDRASLYLVNRDGTGLRALPMARYYSVSSDGRYLLSLRLDGNARRLVRIQLDKLLKQEMNFLDGASLPKKAMEGSAEWERYWAKTFESIHKEAIEEMPIGLTRAFNAASEFVYSPDGRQIAFIADREREFDYRVWLFEAKGQSVRPLTSQEQTSQYNECLRFMPDGRSVLFLRLETNGLSMKNGIWQVGIDGKGLKQIANYTLFDNPLNWKPIPK
jgi:Tol biopolymer transport system component